MKPSPTILFMGTPEFAVAALEAIFRAKYAILGVITAPDSPVGRNQVLTPPTVKIAAQKLNLAVYQPKSKAELIGLAKKLQPDIIIVAAFGMILPKEVLEIPKYGALNVHASLLPRWRGPSPIQAAIMAGDQETGVTIMLLDERMDEGSIIANYELRITCPPSLPDRSCLAVAGGRSGAGRRANYETAEELSKKLSVLGAELLIETLPKYLNGEIKPRKQDDSKATYCKIIKKEDGKINWENSAESVERQIRAYTPWPGTYTKLRVKNEKLRILKIIEAEVSEENHHKIGEMFLTVDKKLAVRCGERSLILLTVQPEGKKPMSGEDFLKGHRELLGSALGAGGKPDLL